MTGSAASLPETSESIERTSIGVGMDSAVIPLKKHNLSLIQTVDFFYPLVDNPETMGKIALANVLSDVYAVGVTTIDKLSLIISSPTDFTEKERDVVIPMIIQGFKASAIEAECNIEVGNIFVNPWCIIGGVATSVCKSSEIIMPCNAKSGDVVVLTKPLGTQLATQSYIWMKEKDDKFKALTQHFTIEDIIKSFNIAVESMSLLNKTGALLMHKYNAHAATDVTGFGLLGHAKNLAEFQTSKVDILIDKLPLIINVKKIGEIVNQTTKLLSGRAPETSGGLLICLPRENAEEFCREYSKSFGNKQNAFIIGRVVDGTGSARLADKPEIEEISFE